MPISAFRRVEVKFIITKAQLDKLTEKLRGYMEPDAHCQNGEDYAIYNIYYDTPDSALIRNSISKPYYKEKLRLRSYFSPAAPDDTVFLELKKKTGKIVHKRRAVMTLSQAQDYLRSGIRPELSGYMNSQVLSEIGYFKSQYDLEEAAYISYRRKAFYLKQDPGLRVTFDYDILTRRRDLSLEKENYGSPLLEKGLYLMEIKTSSSVPVWLSDVLTELSVYKSGFSKYGAEYKRYCRFKSGPEPAFTVHPQVMSLGASLCAGY